MCQAGIRHAQLTVPCRPCAPGLPRPAPPQGPYATIAILTSQPPGTMETYTLVIPKIPPTAASRHRSLLQAPSPSPSAPASPAPNISVSVWSTISNWTANTLMPPTLSGPAGGVLTSSSAACGASSAGADLSGCISVNVSRAWSAATSRTTVTYAVLGEPPAGSSCGAQQLLEGQPLYLRLRLSTAASAALLLDDGGSSFYPRVRGF